MAAHLGKLVELVPQNKPHLEDDKRRQETVRGRENNPSDRRLVERPETRLAIHTRPFNLHKGVPGQMLEPVQPVCLLRRQTGGARTPKIAPRAPGPSQKLRASLPFTIRPRNPGPYLSKQLAAMTDARLACALLLFRPF